MRTVECLRGRLLAERVASKAAKEDADQLTKRLADEVKVRNRAERRLRRAIKKLESLKILDVDLSEGSIGSLSSNGRSVHLAEERNDPGSLTTHGSVLASGPSGDSDADRESSEGSCTQVNSSSRDGRWCSVASEKSRPGSCMDLAGNATSCSSEGSGGDHDSERQHLDASSSGCGSAKSEEAFYESDDRLALVPVDPQLVVAAAAGDGPRTPQDSDTRAGEARATARSHEEEEEEETDKLAIVLAEPQPRQHQAATGRGDVESVLLALRRVKEQLRYTIERRSRRLVAHQELYGH